MNTDELCHAICKKLRPFFDENVKEAVVFHIMFHLKIGVNSHNSINVNTRKGKPILIFSFNNNLNYDINGLKTVETISLDIGHKKYLPLYNKFLKYVSNQSTDSFSLFMNSAKEMSDNLKIIQDIKILPFAKMTLREGNFKQLLMNEIVHAEITTPFETFNVYKRPKIIFDNDQLYLNPEFYFMSYGMDFSFRKKIEHDVKEIDKARYIFANTFYDLHRTQIIGGICKIYNMNPIQVNALTDDEIISNYPVLAMEHY